MSILPADWTPLLTTQHLGRAVNHYAHTLTSTNTVLRDMARQGAPHGCVCLCECQTGGKGRLGRQWSSPERQGIWISVLLWPALAAESAPLATFCTALAMEQAVRETTGHDVRIKWPNDLVLHGRKLCGILLEMGFDERGMYIIAGTGLNVRRGAYPDELADRAVSLEECGGVPSRAAVIAAYLNALEAWMDTLEQQGFAGLEEAFCRRCCTLGSAVQVIGTEETFTGVAEGIDAAGALLVRTDDGNLRRVLAGDVSVRGVMGYV